MINIKTIKRLVRKTIRIITSPLIISDYIAFKKSAGKPRFDVKIRDFYPQILDKTIKTGFERHYVYHTSWAARKLAEIKPKSHTDISSSLYFCGIVSAFVPVKFYDYRPADLSLSNLSCEHADLTKLPFEDNSIESISCMHTVEHIGLGRYGDPFDKDGDLKAIAELKRVVAPGGSLLFVVPVGGHPIVEFNAHRIYTPNMIKEYFSDFHLKEFAMVPERSGKMIVEAEEYVWKNEKYACGCFWFVKP